MSAILDFYDGKGTDNRTRTLGDILAWDDARLESVHDYIQWLFPLPEPSAFNPDAPSLTAADIAAFRADATAQRNLLAAFRRMLRFYGFALDDTVHPSADHATRTANWLHTGNHNLLRVTRILRCLTLLGLHAQASAFLTALEALQAGGASRVIGTRTADFWRRAVQPSAAERGSNRSIRRQSLD